MPISNNHAHQAPTGTLILASALDRFGATLIDFLVLTLAFGVMSAIVLPLLGNQMFSTPGKGFVFLVVGGVLLESLYEGGMTARWGQSLGKMALHSKVVNPDGTRLTGWQPWVRSFSKYLMVTTYILGLVDSLMIFSSERTTMHDRLAGTRVVHVP